MTKISLVIIGALSLGGLSLNANTTCVDGGTTCILNIPTTASGNYAKNAITNTTFTDGHDDVSPYIGTITQVSGTSNIALYCDDSNNTVIAGASYTVDVANVAGSVSTGRYATANPHSGQPTGTTLYEEEAWLFTQMGLATNQSTTTLGKIQDAAWYLTDPTSNNSSDSIVQDWVKAAQDCAVADTCTGTKVENGVSLSVSTANYSNWYIFTDVTVAGNDTTSSGEQEFLAYFTGGSGTGKSGSGTPEPSTMWLLGSALILGGLVTRRKIASVKA